MTIALRCHEYSLNGYEKEIEYKTKCLAQWEDEEPPKFLKKVHAEWEEKIKKLKQEIEIANKKLFEEYEQIGESMKLLHDNKS